MGPWVGKTFLVVELFESSAASLYLQTATFTNNRDQFSHLHNALDMTNRTGVGPEFRIPKYSRNYHCECFVLFQVLFHENWSLFRKSFRRIEYSEAIFNCMQNLQHCIIKISNILYINCWTVDFYSSHVISSSTFQSAPITCTMAMNLLHSELEFAYRQLLRSPHLHIVPVMNEQRSAPSLDRHTTSLFRALFSDFPFDWTRKNFAQR